MQNRPNLIVVGHAFLENFVRALRFPKKLFEKAVLPESYRRMGLHACIAQVHSTHHAYEARKVGAKSTHWDTVLNSPIPDHERKEPDEGVAEHASTKTFLVQHM